MNVIRLSNEDIIRQLGGYQYKTPGREYRMNKYCISVECNEGTVIYNCFTGAIIMIRPVELMNIYTDYPCDYADFLVNNYFIVPTDFNEEELVELLRSRKSVPITANYLDHPLHFTILTTTKCNARCFYCYELGAKGKHSMTIETAEKVARYILDVAPKDQDIKLDWFGGEPLYNSQVIDIITSRIGSAGRNFTSSMISNGYLFDEEMVNRAKNDWRLTNIQITIDGTEEIYNKTKNFIYKDGESPYKRIIKNIHLLTDAGVSVSIRMNCDAHNSENLLQLVDELNEEFKDVKNLSMYVWPIFEENFKRTEKLREELFKSLLEVNKRIYQYGHSLSRVLSSEIKGIHCMVDSGNGVTISPSGDLGLCEHYIDSLFFSHINNPLEKNMDNIKRWRTYSKKVEICKSCPLVPTCLKSPGCPDETPCDKYELEYNLEYTKLALLREWENSKKCDKPTCEDTSYTQVFELVFEDANENIKNQGKNVNN